MTSLREKRILLHAAVAGCWLQLTVCLTVVALDDGPPGNAELGSIEFIAQWGSKGSAEGQFHSPIGIAVGPDDVIYVTDLNNARVQKFDTAGRFIGEFPLPNDDTERTTSQAPGITVGPDGLIHVSFMMQHKVRTYTATGELVREWGDHGNRAPQLNGPGGLVFRGNDMLYVADQRNHRVQVFTPTGKHIGSIGRHGSEMGEFGGSEKEGSRFGGPHYVALDSNHRLFATEGVGRVQRFSAEGKPQIAIGSSGDQPGGFGALKTEFSKNPFGPIGVMVDRKDRVWVSSLNDRVQAFSTDGRYLYGVGSTGDGPGQFSRPHGMAIDSSGFLYVADASNQRIQKFRITDD